MDWDMKAYNVADSAITNEIDTLREERRSPEETYQALYYIAVQRAIANHLFYAEEFKIEAVRLLHALEAR
jgi:hypothetical protein